jgi:hypothetical protein
VYWLQPHGSSKPTILHKESSSLLLVNSIQLLIGCFSFYAIAGIVTDINLMQVALWHVLRTLVKRHNNGIAAVEHR